MPRMLGMLVIAMALATGAAVGNLVSLARPAAPVDHASSQDAANVATMFYEAINVFLATGESAELTGLLAPHFVEHTAPQVDPAPASETVSRLSRMRASHPELRFEVTDLASVSTTVVVTLVMQGEAQEIAGIDIGTRLPRAGQEMLRIEDGLIAERWTFWEEPALFETLTEIDAVQSRAERLELRIERLTFGPDTSIEVGHRRTFVFVVESGQMIQEPVDQSSGGETTLLTRGDAISAPGGSLVRIRSMGSGSAHLLTVDTRLAPPGTGKPQDVMEARSTGVQQHVLVADVLEASACTEATCTLRFGRLELAPGEEIPRHLVDTAEMFIMAAGFIDLQVASGYAVASRPGEENVIVSSQYDLTPGTGIRVQAGAEAGYRSAGPDPAVLWIMTVEAVSDDEEDPA